ncbi:MAG: FAD-dependent oxidoreductase, partial [Comamonadaceae bacterium]
PGEPAAQHRTRRAGIHPRFRDRAAGGGGAGAGAAIAGAIYTPSECAADCQLACAGLAALLARRGAQLRFGVSATGFARQGGRIAAVHTSAGDIPADSFVLALGTASASLARPLGLRLPLYPLKGYSITLELEEDAGAPRVSITDSARKLVFARIGRRLRVAGMAELVGHDASIPAARIETLESATRALFPQCRAAPGSAPWTGMRPATPTGLPIVGRHPRGPENLLLNTGHGALGFTLAFGTAQQVVEALAPARPRPVLRPAPAAPHG